MDFKSGKNAFTPSLSLFFCGFPLLFLLSACGGGGGGEDSEQPTARAPSIPAVSYSGNRNAITIDRDNAVDVAELIVQARSLVHLAETFWIDPPITGGVGDNSRESPGDTGKQLTKTHMNSDRSGFITIDFQGYSISNTRFEGRYIQRFHRREGTFEYSSINGSVEFDGLRIVTPQGDITLQGTVESAGENSQALTANISATDNQHHEQIYLDHLRINFSGQGQGQGQFFGETLFTSMSGSVFEGHHGYVRLRTETPLENFSYDDQSERWSALSGSVIAEGAGFPLSVRALSRTLAAVMLDTDADGSWNEALRVDWVNLDGNDLVIPSTDTAPIANAGNSFPANVGQPATVHALFSHDEDRQFLSFLWQVTQKPGGSQISLENLTSPDFKFTPDVAGDYVFTVWVGDGVHTSKSSVRLYASAENPSEDKPTGTTAGSVEVSGTIGINNPITLDATSSFPNRFESDSWLTWSLFGKPASLWDIFGNYSSTTVTLTTGTPRLYSLSVSNQLRSEEVNLGIGTGPFETAVNINGPVLAQRMLQLDFDGDGLKDFIIESWETSSGYQLSFVKNNGDNRYSIKSAQPGSMGAMMAGDLNGDGRTDIAASGWNGIIVYLQTTTGELAAPQLYSLSACGGSNEADFAVGDFDGDGLADLLALDPCEHSLLVWKQSTAHTLLPATTISLPATMFIQRASFADFNRDGRIDAVLRVSGTPNDIAVTITQPDGSVTVNQTINSNQTITSSINVGDINGDGRPDLVLSNGSRTTIYAQNNAGLFTLYDDFSSTLPKEGPLTIADLNADGLGDICSLSGGLLQIAVQNGNGQFSATGKAEAGFSNVAQAPVVDDINGDGQVDILAPGQRPTAPSSSGMLIALLGGISTYSKPVN